MDRHASWGQRAAVVVVVLAGACAHAVETRWTGAASNDYFTAANWDLGVPMSFADNAIIDGGANLPVVIPAGTGTVELGGFQLGTSGAAGGHVVQNGGTLAVSADFKSHVGDQGTLDSSWIMNNDAVILYDEPLSGGGAGYGFDGGGQDLEIGAQLGAGGARARFEMHDNTVLRIADDLKIAAENNGNAYFLADGNALVTVGSGISVSESSGSVGMLEVAGNALMVAGNSADPGRSDLGFTNEGYLTVSRGGTDANLVPSEVLIRENGRMFIRTLQHRDGLTHLTLADAAEFHIFDVFNFAAPELGVATLTGSVGNSDFTSHVSQNIGSEMLISLSDDAVMTVDSAPAGSFWQGFAMSGGDNRGNPPSAGGKSTLTVADRARFVVQQDLHMTLGFDFEAESTLKVIGPDATVAVQGQLRMSIDDLGGTNSGTSTLHSVITDSSHSTIAVGGDAFIAQGNLLVELSGYNPVGGESYTLLTAASIIGSDFRAVDFSLAPLRDGLSWDLSVATDAIVLSVLGSALLCDFDGNGACGLEDIDMLIAEIASGSPSAGFDLTGDGVVDLADRDAWLSLAGTENLSSGNPYLVADANLDGVVDVTDFNVWNGAKFTTSGLWSLADFNADGSTDVTDFNLWNGNKFQSSAVAAVPEPQLSLLLVLLAWVLPQRAAARRGRRPFAGR